MYLKNNENTCVECSFIFSPYRGTFIVAVCTRYKTATTDSTEISFTPILLRYRTTEKTDSTEKLWTFRPYYLADDGTYYYGDWVGLDPTNTSYFEPTVHTYAKIDVTGNTALVKGYALGGTDNITVQGFKYWKAANLARAEYGDRTETTAVTIPANAQTIEAEGRVMEAAISGLDYESTYNYVAFAKTAEGTFYGEVKTFTTGINTTGIEAIYNSPSEIHISAPKGIYTLTGVKVSDDAADLKTLPRGLYIVNGKKVAVK